jgi:hypothetical protein
LCPCPEYCRANSYPWSSFPPRRARPGPGPHKPRLVEASLYIVYRQVFWVPQFLQFEPSLDALSSRSDVIRPHRTPDVQYRLSLCTGFIQVLSAPPHLVEGSLFRVQGPPPLCSDQKTILTRLTSPTRGSARRGPVSLLWETSGGAVSPPRETRMGGGGEGGSQPASPSQGYAMSQPAVYARESDERQGVLK